MQQRLPPSVDAIKGSPYRVPHDDSVAEVVVAAREYPIINVRLVPDTYVVPEGVFDCFIEFAQYDYVLGSEPDDFVAEPIGYIEAACLSGGRMHFCYRVGTPDRDYH